MKCIGMLAAYVVGVNLLDTQVHMGDAQISLADLGLEPAWAWSGTLASHEIYKLDLMRGLAWHTRIVSPQTNDRRARYRGM